MPAAISLPQQRTASTSRDRLPSLTGLRFWAALLVVCYHLSRNLGKLPVIGDIAWYGKSGVTFFFVLSGFVLAWTYHGNKDGRVGTGTFLWRRCARIVPLHLLTTAISVGVYLALGMALSWPATFGSVLMVLTWVPSWTNLLVGNPAAWSLSDEAFFYLIFPLALALLVALRNRLSSRAWVAVAVGLCLASVAVWLAGSQFPDSESWTRVWFLDRLPLTRSLQFLLGVVIGLAMKDGWRPRVPLLPAALLVLGWHLLLIPWTQWLPAGAWNGAYDASDALAGPVFAVLIIAAASADLRGARTGLGGRWMIRLGHWSFAWYLVHEIGIRIAVHTFGVPTDLATRAVLSLGIAVTTQAAAGLLYQFVEHPAERRLRALGKRRRAETPRGAEDAAVVGAAK